MMRLLTPAGSKVVTPRGVMNSAGVNKALARVGIHAQTLGEVDVWTPAESPAPFTVTAELEVFGYAAAYGDSLVAASPATGVATGAVGAVTWLWERVTGSVAFVIGAPTEATSVISKVVASGDTDSGTFTITGTDSIGRTASATVTANLTNYGWSGY